MEKLTRLSLLMVLLLPACSRPPASTSAPSSTPDPAAIEVVTIAAQQQPMPRYLRVTGELKGSRQAMLAPDASGKVVAAPIERGSVVKAGDVILKLDDRAATHALHEADASVADAELKLEWARSEFTRNETLAKGKLISSAEFERQKIDRATAEALLAAATARRDQAKKSLDDTVLRAPFAGTVAERLSEVGEYVSSTTGVAKLVATEHLRLLLNVPETAVGFIQEGQMVSFAVPAFPAATFKGTVKFIGAALRESGRDLIIEAEVGNADGRLKPGMFAEGKLALADECAVTVPATALRNDGGSNKVFVIQDGRIEERLVELGEKKGDAVEIRRGVLRGDAVVVAPGAAATDGVKVALTAQP